MLSESSWSERPARVARLVLAAAALCIVVASSGGGGGGGALELAWGVDRDNSLVAHAASSLRTTIATAEGSPSPWSPAGEAGLEDDVALGDVGGSLSQAMPQRGSSEGEKALAAASAQLRRAERAAVRRAKIKLAEAEKAKLEKRMQRERVEYTRVALKERARQGEEEAQQMRKELQRREAHLEHLARERSRQREARREVERARKWTQHQQALRQLFAGKLDTRLGNKQPGGAHGKGAPTIDFHTSALAASALPQARSREW